MTTHDSDDTHGDVLDVCSKCGANEIDCDMMVTIGGVTVCDDCFDASIASVKREQAAAKAARGN